MSYLNVFEIYPSIQGESTRAGRKCVFIRLAGCNLDCAYCDSSEAAKGNGQRMETDAIMEKIKAFGINLVEVTGGEPLAQEAAKDLLDHLAGAGYETLVETNGSVNIAGFTRKASYIVDVKTPGSGAGGSFDERNLEALMPGDELKFVVTSREDFDWAEGFVRAHGLEGAAPILYSPAEGMVSPKALAGWMMEARTPARLNLQLHKIIWGPGAKGV